MPSSSLSYGRPTTTTGVTGTLVRRSTTLTRNFFDVQAWVYKNFDSIGGLSFFPFDDFIYDEATQPYLPITKERYDEEVAKFPKDIDLVYGWLRVGR